MDDLCFCEHSNNPVTITTNTTGVKPFQVTIRVCSQANCIHSHDCNYGISSPRNGNGYEPVLMR